MNWSLFTQALLVLIAGGSAGLAAYFFHGAMIAGDGPGEE